MNIEVIFRREGFKSEKHIVGAPGAKPQISFNSDGRIVLRYIESSERDDLIVLGGRISELLIDFCQNSLKNNYIREGARTPQEDLPF